MLRKFAVGLAALGALNAAQVKALGLGEVTVHSALNQPLDAEIDLLQIRDLAASQIVTGLADSDEFYLAGVKPTAVLSDIRFELDLREGGGKIFLSTREPIREPFLNFLVEVNWPSGRLVREYTVLLDPPVFTAKDLAPRSAPPAAPLTQGAQLSQVAPSQPAAVTPPSRTAAADSYRVGKDDTLWSIALKTRPDATVSPQQMMLAIQRANPEAFIGNNINRLKSGAVLRIPGGAEVASLGGADSVNEVNRQNRAWRSEEAQASAPQGEQLDATAATMAEKPTEAENDASRLRIVSKPAEESPAEAPAETGTLVADETQAEDASADPLREELLNKNLELEEQLVVTLEGLDKVERDNAELFQRLDQLGNQMASLQRLLELKDQQLAELQVSLSQAQAQSEAAPAPVAPEESGLMGTLMKYPASLAGALAALLALVGGGLLLARKRKQQEEQAVTAAMAELDARDGQGSEGAADLKAAGVAGAAGAAAAVAAAQSQADGSADEQAGGAGEDSEDPFNLASEETGDEFDSLTSEDLDASLGDDLDMDLKIDEPIEEDPEMAEFADSLLSDDDYDLGADEASAEDASVEAGAVNEPDEELLETPQEETDDLDFLLADQESSAVGETVDVAAEDDDDLDFILGGVDDSPEAAEEPEADLESETGLESETETETESSDDLDDLDDLLAMNSPEAEDVSTDPETAAAAPEEAVEPAVEEEPEVLGELDDLLASSSVDADALNEEPASVPTEEDAETDGLDSFFESSEAEAADIAAEQTGEPVAAPEVEEDRDDIDRLLAEAGADAGVIDTDAADVGVEEAEASPEGASLADESEEDLDALFASFGAEQPEQSLEQESAPSEEKAEDDAFEGFNLELEDDEAAAEVEAADEPSAQSEAQDAGGVSAPEEDLDLAGDEDLENELNLMLEEEGNGLSLEETALGEAESETDYLDGADEVGTKLDLARAYLDMDDSDGARDILDEVLKEGSSSQKEEAKQLLATLKQ